MGGPFSLTKQGLCSNGERAFSSGEQSEALGKPFPGPFQLLFVTKAGLVWLATCFAPECRMHSTRSRGIELLGDRGNLQAREEEGEERPGPIFPSAVWWDLRGPGIPLSLQCGVCIAWRVTARAHPLFVGTRQRAALLVGKFPGCLKLGSVDMEGRLFIKVIWKYQQPIPGKLGPIPPGGEQSPRPFGKLSLLSS